MLACMHRLTGPDAIDTDYLASISVGGDRLEEWLRLAESVVSQRD